MRLVYTDILFYSILVYLVENDLRRGRHVVFNLHVQLLFVAKYRRAVFTKQVLDDLEVIFADVCNKLEAELVAFDGKLSASISNSKICHTKQLSLRKHNYLS